MVDLETMVSCGFAAASLYLPYILLAVGNVVKQAKSPLF